MSEFLSVTNHSANFLCMTLEETREDASQDLATFVFVLKHFSTLEVLSINIELGKQFCYHNLIVENLKVIPLKSIVRHDEH